MVRGEDAKFPTLLETKTPLTSLWLRAAEVKLLIGLENANSESSFEVALGEPRILSICKLSEFLPNPLLFNGLDKLAKL